MPGLRGRFASGLNALTGAIRRAVGFGASTQQIFETVAPDVPGTTIADIGSIVSSDLEIINAVNTLNDAQSYEVVTPDMFAVAPYARESRQHGTGGPYAMRIPYTNPNESEGTISGWITIHTNALPATVGDLLGLAQAELDKSISPRPGAQATAGLSVLEV